MPVCGVTKTLADAPESLPDTWSGVTVVCIETSHADEGEKPTHWGPVVVDGVYEGLHCWGPGSLQASPRPAC